jgi:predicted acyltransferase
LTKGLSHRLISLDAFRGATIAAMLLVNNPGSGRDVYAPLRHAAWHGWTPTDLVFPFFLWIVGVAITFAFAQRVAAGADNRQLMAHVWRRAAIIFLLGLFLNAFPFGLLSAHHFSLATLRLPGVLQRIALCYLAASAIFLRSTWRGQLAWTGGLLVVYSALLMLVPVPGYGAGQLSAQGSLPWWIDSHILAGHTWSGAPTPGFDPEGLLSTLPAIATTLLGVLAGQILRTGATDSVKALRLGGLGVTLLISGLGLVPWMPINKNLWTSSFTLFTAGAAALICAGFYWLIEVRGYRRWATPLIIYGSNAIVIFVLAGLLGRLLGVISWVGPTGAAVTLKGWIYATAFVPYATPVNASLLFAVAFVLLHLLIAGLLWRRQWFVRI